MADVKWVKLYTDMFDNKKIKQIKQMPEGKAILLVWVQLIVLAGQTNDNGAIYFTKEIAFTDEMLSTQFDEKLEIIRGAINVFRKFGMIEVVNDIIYLANWEKYQSNDKLQQIQLQNRERVARFRANQKQITSNVTSNVTVTQSNAIDIEQDIEQDKDNIHIRKSKYGEYKNVLLTDDEFAKITDKRAIEFLSEYKQMTGKKYKSDYLAIKKWVYDALKEKKNPYQKESPVPEWYDKYTEKQKNKPKIKVELKSIEELEKETENWGK